MITVLRAPPFLTVQDAGRVGHRALGVPPSGYADGASARTLEVLLGAAPGSALLEWAVGGGVLRFDVPLSVAVGGATVQGALDGAPITPFRSHRVRAGAELRIERLVRGRFAYVAVDGGIDVPLVLGSRSTLVSAGLGGYEGRRLRTGDVLRAFVLDDEPRDAIAVPAHSVLDDASIPVVPGPHLDRVDASVWRRLLATEWRVSLASDRSGVRLDGPSLASAPAARPSEPTCVGAVQLPPDGRPIVLMHDGPTVGGYPIVAVLRSDTIARFAQRAPSDTVRFSET